MLWVLICTVHLTVCYHDTHEFQSESTLRNLPECQITSCSKQAPYLKFKLQQRVCTHNHLVHKRILNHLAKLAKWLSCVVSTDLYSAFELMLSCHVRVWDECTLYSLPGTIVCTLYSFHTLQFALSIVWTPYSLHTL